MGGTDFSYVYWIHILFAGPLFVYIGYYKENVPDVVYSFLIILGLVVMAYHGYKLAKYKKLI